MSADVQARLHAIMRGRVQGVGFRYFVRTRAQELGLTGWVRNLRDGGVETVAEGVRPQLEELLKSLGQGPRGSGVTDVRTEWGDASGEFDEFAIKPTA